MLFKKPGVIVLSSEHCLSGLNVVLGNSYGMQL